MAAIKTKELTQLASSFGWNFQENAGIYLFLHYIKDAQSLKIESKLQDIEISLNDSKKILAQVKSAQDPSSAKDKKERFKDALISISKSSEKEPEAKYIYVSNITGTFKSAPNAFDNKIRSYSECQQVTKEEIDKTIGSLANGLENKVADSKTTKKKKAILQKAKKLLNNLNKRNLYLLTISEYYGDENNRYNSIRDKIIDLLRNKIKLSRDDTNRIVDKLLNHWQSVCGHNSTVDDCAVSKEISKSDFIWPVFVYLIDSCSYDIRDSLSFPLNHSTENEVKTVMEKMDFLYHERFAFSNKIIQDFLAFQKTCPIYDPDLEKNFIKKKGMEYCDEFKTDDCDQQKLEYMTKLSIYKILMNYRVLNKICSETGISL